MIYNKFNNNIISWDLFYILVIIMERWGEIIIFPINHHLINIPLVISKKYSAKTL